MTSNPDLSLDDGEVTEQAIEATTPKRTIAATPGMLMALSCFADNREQRHLIPGFRRTTMDYQVSLAGGGRFILIKVLVPMTSAIGVRCGTEAVRVGAARKVDRFLFDLRDSPNVQSVIDNYEFAHQEISDFGFPIESRSAFLVRPNDRSHDFINTAFHNAGYVTRMFSEPAAAIAWLEQGSPTRARPRDWHNEFL